MVLEAIIPMFDLVGTIGFLVAAVIGIRNYRDTLVARVFWLSFTFAAGLGALWLGLVTLEWIGVRSVLLDTFSTSLQAVVIGVFAVGSLGALGTIDDLKRSHVEADRQRKDAESAKADAEARKRQLEQTQELLREVEQLATVGGWERSLEANTFRVTRGIRNIVEASAESLSNLDDLVSYFRPGDGEAFREAVESCREDGTPYELELRMITEGGKEIWVQTRGSCELVNGATVERGVIAEISSRKEREQRLMVLNRVLRHNLRNKLTVILGHAGELEKALSAIEVPEKQLRDDVHGTVRALGRSTDDLQDDLDILERLLDQMLMFRSEEARKHARKILESSDDIAALSEKVHQFQQATRSDGIPRDVAIAPIVEQLKEEFLTKYPAVDIELREIDVTIRGFPDGIRFVLSELVENAIVHAERATPRIVIEGGRHARDRVCIRVADTGPGIPAIEREVLSRGRETPLSHGSGIGLWTVHWMVTRFGGSVDIFDNDLEGTTVELSFPSVDHT